jgi:glycosyltransferase involved in cell wall biosynthesis
VRAAAGELLARSVPLPGLVYDESDLAPLFMGADLFVLAGAAGLSVNHALAYGLPVLAFRRTPKGPFHHPEICYVIEGVTGWLVDEFADHAFAARLVEVVQHPLRPRERLGAMIDRFVDENLTLDHLVDDLRRIVEHVAALPGRRAA